MLLYLNNAKTLRLWVGVFLYITRLAASANCKYSNRERNNFCTWTVYLIFLFLLDKLPYLEDQLYRLSLALRRLQDCSYGT